MKILGSPPPEIQSSGSRCTVRRGFAVAERCSASRVRYAKAQTAALLTPPRRSTSVSFGTDGSAGNQMNRNFFVLPKTKTKLQ